MKIIDVDQLVLFHNKILKATGGSSGVRDRSILESALQRPFSTFDGSGRYLSMDSKTSGTKNLMSFIFCVVIGLLCTVGGD